MDNNERSTQYAAAQESLRKKRRGPLQRLEIHRRGAKADHGWSPVEFYRMSVKFEDDALVSISGSGTEGAFILSSPEESVAFPPPQRPHTPPAPPRSSRTRDARHIYEIVVPYETARAIVEAYCEKLAASPEIAAAEQHRSLAPALARLLCAILEGA